MFRNLFDHPATLLVVVLVVVLVFGAKRLPDVSRSLARSMRIFKSEVREMKEEDGKVTPTSAASSPAPGSSTSSAYPLEGRVVDATESERVHDASAEPRRSA